MPQRLQIPRPLSLRERYMLLRRHIHRRVCIVFEILCGVVRCTCETVRNELRRWGRIDVDLAEGDARFEVSGECSES